ncbi:PilZ domain-containing protein [Beggiatoa alba B18LD]|uniref:PilZ domain-containing protein n=1 Tax=Beggiatoa alba B18LD TaxID=395493 RepID=I3CBF2_9GAMM|nr:PilZ domain-containing protein [Beggiatoa alba]EIJ40945.1 PilZ domain-containing protein [Beggiatoa alba B18LD]
MHNTHPSRRHLFLYLEIIDRDTQTLLGHLGDLSKEGVLIITDKPLKMNGIYNIRIQLPEDEDISKPYIDVKVEVRWEKPDINPALQLVGCHFIEIDPEDLYVIDDVSEVLGFNE